jgi:hypothetical protein
MMTKTFAVLVIDMAHAADEDGSRVVDGFAGFEAARAYAEARTRASVEELRGESRQSAAELRSLWHIYGEDCLVIGGGYVGRDLLDRYIATPASRAERDWTALAPDAMPQHVATWPPPPGGSRWRVEVRFDCPDTKFRNTVAGEFHSAGKPEGEALREIERKLVSDALTMRGDGPQWADRCNVLEVKVSAVQPPQ